MAGRYGRDDLNRFLYLLCFLFLVLSFFLRDGKGRSVFYYLAGAVLVILFYRTLSRNHAARAAENRQYLQIRQALFGRIGKKRQELKDAEHAYFSCPNCKKRLRVPKGKGRIQIHCPQCGKDFIKKT